jgi:excisionase family DNA binding protein
MNTTLGVSPRSQLLLTYRDAAERCGLTVRTLQRAVAAETLTAVRFGHRTVRIQLADLEAWISSNATTSAKPQATGA